MTYHRADADAQRGGVLVAQVVGDLDLQVAFGNDVVRKTTAIRPQRVGSVDNSADTVTLFEGLVHFGPDLLDDASVVAAYTGPYGAHAHVNVLPVCRVESHGRGADEDVVIRKLWEGYRLDFSRSGLGDDHGIDL